MARQRWTVGCVAAVVALTIGTVGCGDSGSSSKPAVTTAAETAGVAGNWSGTWNEAGVGSRFNVTIDCTGRLTGTLAPSGGGDAESATGTVTTWVWDQTKGKGSLSADMTIGDVEQQLTGSVVRTIDPETDTFVFTLSGSVTVASNQTAGIVLTISGSPLICTAQQVADLSSGGSVSADLISAVDDAATTCTGTGADPYSGDTTTDNVAILLKPNAGGTVDVSMTFAPTDTPTAQVGVIGISTDSGSELRFTGVGTTSGTDYLATLDITLDIGGDGTLTGTFVGNVDADGDDAFDGANDCSAISGTLSGSTLVP